MHGSLCVFGREVRRLNFRFAEYRGLGRSGFLYGRAKTSTKALTKARVGRIKKGVRHVLRICIIIACSTIPAHGSDAAGIVPLHYSLVLTPDFANKTLAGEESIEIRVS